MSHPGSDEERLRRLVSAPTGNWDPVAIRAGALICITFAVPFRLLAAALGDRGALDIVFFLVFLAFFVIGAGTAAWVQRCGTPMSHALVTAAGTFVVVEAAFVVVRLVRGTEVPWLAIMFTLTIVVMAGLVGGFLGNRLHARGAVPSIWR